MHNTSVTKEEVLELVNNAGSLASELGCIVEKDALNRLEVKLSADEWFLTVLGETSSGKSTFINSLLNDDLLPVSAPATTGVVTLIQCYDSPNGYQFYSLGSDGRIDAELSRDDFRQAARGGMETTRLLARKSAIEGLLSGLTLVDTPGFNSCLTQHTEVLNSYLPESDAAIFLVNYKLGVRKQDVDYFNLISQVVTGDCQTENPLRGVLVAVNFGSLKSEDKRIQEIRERLKEHCRYQGPIYVLRAERLDGRHRLSNDALLKNMAELQCDPRRGIRQLQNACVLADEALRSIGELLELKRHVFFAEEANVGIISERLIDLRRLRESMVARVDRATRELRAQLLHLSESGKIRVRSDVQTELSEASRWTQIESASVFVSEIVLECGVMTLAQDLSEIIRQEMTTLNKDLEGLAANVEENIQKLLDLPLQSSFGGIEERLLRKAAERLGGRGIGGYLAQLAGAPGGKGVVGVMNLARKLMGSINRLWGRTIFGREAMAQVGGVLKQFGLTSSRVAGAAASVALEIASYLYRVKTWKEKLRTRLEPVIEEQVSMLHIQASEAVDDLMASTRRMVEDNYGRRIEVIENTLSERERGRTISPDQMAGWAARWHHLATECERIQQEFTGG